MLLVSSAAVVAETFTGGFNQFGGGGKFNATDGPEVTLGKDLDLEGGQPATDKSINLSKQDGAWLNVSAEAGGPAVTVDTINSSTGANSWTNVSSVSGTSSANITLQPSEGNFSRIGGEITEFKFRDPKVEDGQSDLIYSATGQSTIVVETNATAGTQYGLVDVDTNEGIGVATAESDGTIHFTEVDSGSNREARIEELGSLFIRNETEPHDLVTDATVEIMFFEDQDDNPTIVERTATNGEVELTGLPVNEQFVVTVTNADPYFDRQVLLDDLSQQETIFLLNSSMSAVDNRFEIIDRTGEFGPGETELILQKSINRSQYGGSPPGFSWTTIAGDDLGSDQAVQWDLAEGDRYRIIVENADGDRRILGSYTAKQTGTVELDIGQVVEDPEGPDQIAAEATWANESGTVTVKFEYNDSSQNTDRLWVHIFERGNESNELLANQSFSGPLGAQSITETVPADQEDNEWVVKFVAERDGENAKGQYVVGPTRTILGSIPPYVKTIIAIGSIIVVAGLFSQLNGGVGGLVVAGMGAMYHYVNFMPPEISDGVVVLALLTAGVIFIRERRGGGTGL